MEWQDCGRVGVGLQHGLPGEEDAVQGAPKYHSTCDAKLKQYFEIGDCGLSNDHQVQQQTSVVVNHNLGQERSNLPLPPPPPIHQR